ncbi:MAG TPA: hypothetical protein VIF62_38935 [Labilithrix sp.]
MDKSIAFAMFAAPLLFTACGTDDGGAATPAGASPDETLESAPSPYVPFSAARVSALAGMPILHADFEDASPQCNDWTSEGGTGIRSIPPRTGDYACKICSSGEVPVLALANATGPLEPGRYVLQAWVRARAPSVKAASVVLEAETSDGMLVEQGTSVMVDDAYAPVEVVLDAPSSIVALQLRVEAPAAKSECVLVDDVMLVRR